MVKQLFPQIEQMLSPIRDKKFEIPFDPHDMKYFYADGGLRKHMEKDELPDGVRRIIRNEKDIRFIYDKDGEIIGERVAPHSVVYFLTHKDFACLCTQGDDALGE